MKNILVSGYIGFNNFGDEAIFYALSTHLKKLGHNVSVLCNNEKEVKQKYNVITYHFKKPFEIIKAILKNDILISGGGSLLQNKTSNFSLFYYLFIILFAKLCFKKVIIFAQGIEPIVGKFPELSTKIVLNLVDFISVRDEKSKSLLDSWKIKSCLVSDPAYSLVQDLKTSEKKEDLTIQLRNFKGIKKEFISNLAFLIAKHYQNKINVFSFQNEIDENICLRFIEELKKYNIKANYLSNKTIEQTIDIINNSKYVISTRLHGLIISSALKTKTFALSYDEKIKTLTSELEIENIDVFNYSKEEFDKKLEAFFTQENKTYNYRRFEWEKINKEL